MGKQDPKEAQGSALQDSSGFMAFVHKLDKITGKTVDTLAVVLLLFIFIIGIAQVVWRWVLNDPIVWSEELIRLTYVWIFYLGWVIAERSDSHIRITMVSSRLPKTAQKYLQIFCHILCIVMCALMVRYGIDLIIAGTKRTAVSFPMNYAVVYLMGPICNFIMIFYEIAQIIECVVVGPRDYSDKGGDEE